MFECSRDAAARARLHSVADGLLAFSRTSTGVLHVQLVLPKLAHRCGHCHRSRGARTLGANTCGHRRYLAHAGALLFLLGGHVHHRLLLRLFCPMMRHV